MDENWLDEFETDIKSQCNPDKFPNLYCTLTSTQNLSLQWIMKHQSIVNFNILIKKPNLSKEILCEFLDKFNWVDIYKYQILDENFINKYRLCRLESKINL